MSRRWPHLLILAVIVYGFAASARGDWPHLRGPHYDGVSDETGLAGSWPAGGPPLLWSRPLSQGHSGIVIAGGRLYTQWQSAAGQFLVCLDASNGKVLWETRYDRAWQTLGAYPGPYATPTHAAGKVFFASPTGLIGCADEANGSIAWSLDIHERFGGRGRNFGFAATPLVADGRVYFPVGGPGASMVALDASDGSKVWAAGDDPASYCPAMPIEWKGRNAIVGYLENSLTIFSAVDGNTLCHVKLSAGYDEHSAWPLYREPHLLLTAPFRAPARRLKLNDTGNASVTLKETWSSKSLSNDVVSSVLYRDRVYGFDLKQLQSSAHRPSRGTFRCLDWNTGDVLWSTDRVGQATALAADDKLFLWTDAGELILARADGAGYYELGRVSLAPDEICWTPPALCRGRLYVRSPSRLFCLDVSAGNVAPLAPLSVGAPIPTVWRVDSSWLFVREREFPNDAPTFDELRLWLGVSLMFLGIAGLAAISVNALAHRFSVFGVMMTVAFVLGLIGPNLVSAAWGRCVFTWPLSVFIVLHVAVRACAFESRFARLWIVALILACAGYFLACRMVGLSIGWYYLVGLPAGFPLSACSAFSERRRPGWSAILMLLAFVATVAGGQTFLIWNAYRPH